MTAAWATAGSSGWDTRITRSGWRWSGGPAWRAAHRIRSRWRTTASGAARCRPTSCAPRAGNGTSTAKWNHSAGRMRAAASSTTALTRWPSAADGSVLAQRDHVTGVAAADVQAPATAELLCVDAAPVVHRERGGGRCQHAHAEVAGDGLVALDARPLGNVELEHRARARAQVEAVAHREGAVGEVEPALPATQGGVAGIGGSQVGVGRERPIRPRGHLQGRTGGRALVHHHVTRRRIALARIRIGALEAHHVVDRGALLDAAVAPDVLGHGEPVTREQGEAALVLVGVALLVGAGDDRHPHGVLVPAGACEQVARALRVVEQRRGWLAVPAGGQQAVPQ